MTALSCMPDGLDLEVKCVLPIIGFELYLRNRSFLAQWKTGGIVPLSLIMPCKSSYPREKCRHGEVP